jgi:hypothetical protein
LRPWLGGASARSTLNPGMAPDRIRPCRPPRPGSNGCGPRPWKRGATFFQESLPNVPPGPLASASVLLGSYVTFQNNSYVFLAKSPERGLATDGHAQRVDLDISSGDGRMLHGNDLTGLFEPASGAGRHPQSGRQLWGLSLGRVYCGRFRESPVQNSIVRVEIEPRVSRLELSGNPL